MMLTIEHGIRLWLIRRVNRLRYSRFAFKLDYYRRYGIFVHLKFAIAQRLNKNPDYCWPHLVMWALGYRKWYSILSERFNEYDYKSQWCPGHEEYAYCGKCRVQGRMAK